MNYVNMLYICVLMVIIMASAFLFSEKFRYSINTDNYKGYLVYDEEMVGFFPCNGGEPYGIDYRGEIDIRSIYQSHKTKLREPVYFEFVAETTDSGVYGSGLVPEPAHNYLRVTELNKVGNNGGIDCDFKFPFRVVEEVVRDL